jgi:hypothetical protein
MEPAILIAQRVDQLCEKCGNFVVNVTDRLDPPPESFNGYDKDKDKDKDKDADEAEEAALQDEPEPEPLDAPDVEEAPDIPTTPDETAVSFEEVDNMNKAELIVLAGKLNLATVEGMEIESIREGIKATLTHRD